jgi:hypothetical protein
MIDSINWYRKRGWKVSVNNNNQVIFTDPETDTFFSLSGATKSEREYVEFSKSINYGIGIRKRFIHRREQS